MTLATRVTGDVSALRRWIAAVFAWLAVLAVSAPVLAVPEARGMVANSATSGKQPTYVPPPDQPHLEGPLPELRAPPRDFRVYEGGWIRFVYPPATRERIQPLIEEADHVRTMLQDRLGQAVLPSVEVRVARTPTEMTMLAPEGAPYPKYASGVAYSQFRLVLLTLQADNPNALHDLGEIFRHELAHIALYDAVGHRHVVPRWFNEGFAVHASGESSLTRLQTLWTATLAGNLIPLIRIENSFPSDSVRASVAYAESADIVRFLLKREETERFAALIRRLRNGQTFAAALADSYGVDLSGLEYEWRQEVAKRYSFWPVFFSGSLVWIGALGLFVVGWRRRKRRSKATLDRWSREEAMEDARRARPSSLPPGRVHIVFPAAQAPPELPPPLPKPSVPDGDVPKVEHDGRWHTLH